MKTSNPFRRCWLVLLLMSLLLSTVPVVAQKTGKQARKDSPQSEKIKPKDYRSKHFLIHTDLSAEKAEELLKKLETMLSLISRYWGQRNRKTIECYVIEDLSNWSMNRLPPDGLNYLRSGGGITISRTTIRGNRSWTKSVVYAVAGRGTPQHEAVHAYCAQVFGTSGPVWYSEGMAEMGNYWRDKDSSVNCAPWVVEYLRNSEPKSLHDIINVKEFTGDSWQNYAWRWAVCHMLANNPNYAPRFRPLGLSLLTRQRGASFNKTYGSMKKEIVFEYLFFLEHLERGFRVDLCSWDWKARFRPLRSSRSITAKINSARGWQPSRLLLKDGEEYKFSTSGDWKLGTDSESLSADGNAKGRGKLVGIVLQDNGVKYKLSEPFELGANGSFSTPAAGQLWLRCKDEWNHLDDNSGIVSVKIKIKRSG
jgi:hypothetical protein